MSSAKDSPTQILLQYEPWLRLIARLEIESRFQAKFSASDAVQQTMVAAWQNWSRFEGDDELQRRKWLRQILAFQLAKLARRYAGVQKRDVVRERSIEASLAQSSMRLANLLVAAQPSPSEAAIANEQSLLLALALEQLPDAYRQVIVLRNLEGLSHEQVATRMNRSEGAVKMLWMRALTELQKQMNRP